MEEKRISKAVISRLPRYYRYLGELIQEKVERISSKELSIRMKVTASQIRQDLNNFGGFGQQGYGYNVKYLHNEIGKILGIDRENNLIVIGGGHLGQAIANYANFERRGFYIKAIFDIDPEIIGKEVRGVRVYSMGELEDFIKKMISILQPWLFQNCRPKKWQSDWLQQGLWAFGIMLILIFKFPTMSLWRMYIFLNP